MNILFQKIIKAFLLQGFNHFFHLMLTSNSLVCVNKWLAEFIKAYFVNSENPTIKEKRLYAKTVSSKDILVYYPLKINPVKKLR